jgi:hypothetical protein
MRLTRITSFAVNSGFAAAALDVDTVDVLPGVGGKVVV